METRFYATAHAAPVQEKLAIVPSPRIDWCSACEKEHGYDCPKDATQEKKCCRNCFTWRDRGVPGCMILDCPCHTAPVNQRSAQVPPTLGEGWEDDWEIIWADLREDERSSRDGIYKYSAIIKSFIAKKLSEEREALIKECQKLENQILIAGKNGREAERQRLRVAIGGLKKDPVKAFSFDGVEGDIALIEANANNNALDDVLKILGETNEV